MPDRTIRLRLDTATREKATYEEAAYPIGGAQQAFNEASRHLYQMADTLVTATPSKAKDKGK